MPDVRVIKTMGVWLMYIVASCAVVVSMSYAGHKLLDISAEAVLDCIIVAFAFYTLYQFAKIKVDMERSAEQRLVDNLRDMK